MSQDEDPEHVRRGLQVIAQKIRTEPFEIARFIVFPLNDEASYVMGAVYNVEGGWVCEMRSILDSILTPSLLCLVFSGFHKRLSVHLFQWYTSVLRYMIGLACDVVERL